MLDETKKSFATGLSRVKWIATFLAERTRAEASFAKLSFDRSKLENRMDALYRDVGRRVLELEEEGKADVFGDPVIQQSIDQLKVVRASLSDNRKQSDKIDKMPAE